MAKGILGTKLGMTQIFNEAGEVVPVTVVAVEGNVNRRLRGTSTRFRRHQRITSKQTSKRSRCESKCDT